MSLVKGFTDILTPVNLIPNSDFLRGGGLPTVVTRDTLNNASAQVAENIFVVNTASGVSVSNLVVTRSGGNLNIKAHITRSSLSNQVIALYSNRPKSRYGQVYTNRCYLKDNSNNQIRPTIGFEAGTTTTFYQEYKDNVCVNVRTPGGDNTYPLIRVYSDSTASELDIDIDVSEFASYEGAFCNPPYIKSLDSNPSTTMFAEYNNIQEIIMSNDYDTLGSIILLRKPLDYTLNTSDRYFQYFARVYIPCGKKVKAPIARVYAGNGSNTIIQFDVTASVPSYNLITYMNKFSQLIAWRATYQTSISNTINQTIRTDYRGTSYIPVTFEVTHLSNSSYTRVSMIVDTTAFTNYSVEVILEITALRNQQSFIAPGAGFTDLTNS